jgi:hypothetical protein
MSETITIKLLVQFLGTVFSQNCKCFQGTCSIQTDDPFVDRLIDLLRSYQNPKTCKTFFQGTPDYREVINIHMRSFIKMGLLQKRDGQFYLANGQAFEWQNVLQSHTSVDCYCMPLLKVKSEFVSMMSQLSNRGCMNTKGPCTPVEIKVPTDVQLHLFTHCLFWYFRKAIVDSLLQYCYFNNSLNSISARGSVTMTPINFSTPRASTASKSRPSTSSRPSSTSRLLGSGENETQSFPTLLPDLDMDFYFPSDENDVEVGMKRASLLPPIGRNFKLSEEYLPDEFKSQKAKSCQAVSVGSLRLTSDYDVTLYGTCVTNVIKDFYGNFSRIFGKTSSTIFDTNLYGSSFIEVFDAEVINPPKSFKFYSTIDCSNFDFDEELYRYLDSPYQALKFNKISAEQEAICTVQQHLFALLKLKVWVKVYFLRNEKTLSETARYFMMHILQILTSIGLLNMMERMFAKDDHIYIQSPVANISEDVSDSLPDELIIDHEVVQFFQDLGIGMESLNNKTSSPTKSPVVAEYYELPFQVVRDFERYEDVLTAISIFNFFGQETYYTRGAFMHVVMKMQTCPKEFKGFDDLTFNCYFDSLIENLADFIMHEGKTKYLVRMLSAFSNLDPDDVPHELVDAIEDMLERKFILTADSNEEMFLLFLKEALDYLLMQVAQSIHDAEEVVKDRNVTWLAWKKITKCFDSISKVMTLTKSPVI